MVGLLGCRVLSLILTTVCGVEVGHEERERGDGQGREKRAVACLTEAAEDMKDAMDRQI